MSSNKRSKADDLSKLKALAEGAEPSYFMDHMKLEFLPYRYPHQFYRYATGKITHRQKREIIAEEIRRMIAKGQGTKLLYEPDEGDLLIVDSVNQELEAEGGTAFFIRNR